MRFHELQIPHTANTYTWLVDVGRVMEAIFLNYQRTWSAGRIMMQAAIDHEDKQLAAYREAFKPWVQRIFNKFIQDLESEGE